LGRISKAGDPDVRRALNVAASAMLTRYKGKTALKSRRRSNRALDGVGVKFDAAVVREAGQTM
jgi:transposase